MTNPPSLRITPSAFHTHIYNILATTLYILMLLPPSTVWGHHAMVTREPFRLVIAMCVLTAQHHQPWKKLLFTHNGFIVWNVCILNLSTAKNRILCGVIRMIFWWNLQYGWNRLQMTVNAVTNHLCYLEWYNRMYHYLIMEFLIFKFITYS